MSTKIKLETVRKILELSWKMPSEDGSDTDEQQGATWEHQSLAQVEYLYQKHDGDETFDGSGKRLG